MITAGIDVGLESTKIVILRDGKIIGRGKGLSGGAGRSDAVMNIYNEALKEAGIAASEVAQAVATGKGKFDAGVAEKNVTETVAAAKVAGYLFPGATMVVSIGADETLVATLGEDSKILEFALNQKCAAGLGIFLMNIAQLLEMTPEQMGSVAPGTKAMVNDGCVVFAELDALTLLSEGMPPAEVASAATSAVAVRAHSVIHDITAPNWDRVVLIGGMTKNPAFIRELKAETGIDFIIPEEAEFASALGAALIAAG